MPDPDKPAKVERREERRAKSWPALLRLADGRELPCFVRDVSRTGAKVVLPSAFPLARTFLLRIDQQGIALQVRLAWRREHECGVRIERMARLPSSGRSVAVEANAADADNSSDPVDELGSGVGEAVGCPSTPSPPPAHSAV